MFSFTLSAKSAGYKRTRNTRVFLCDESGREALEWSLESLVQDGDELIVFRGVDEDVLEKDHDAVREEARELMRDVQEKSAECAVDRKVRLHRSLANLASVHSFEVVVCPTHYPPILILIPCHPPTNIPQQLSLILEYIPGKITDTLDRLIALYRPDSVVVGTRGRRPWVRGIGGIGSVSK
jgi:hypothetical protein